MAGLQPRVQALVDAWTGTFNAGRTGDLIAFYAPAARLVPPGRPVLTGAPALSGFFADIRAQGFRDYRVVIDDVFGREGEPAATGRWTLSGPGPDGERHRYDGNWLMLLDGTPSARILLHMWN
ncbi:MULTISPECIES: nuclear transport factor 2 family protein [Methylobacterium]|uniref:SnoaL-like domain-containing protein n=1 Tax=Methylobacterium jeotgali TaxID=381630 RepID=A0ABQ4SY28_9HYPH|nr:MULTISPECIES: nuclear transport factor 2 family protein [Methylobacterium]PIU07290.1 MAG: hypothetical protein COT56_05515 [Methylobacterium sp. CG09_land_8_20_14_0_10_71_15]PIU11847.1 MAG: hypothetical protein COT28_17940 [Methylobacterium sp. CG08_land_8_20_14_0_20_71_15]GBU20087.1 hypothetical protein AwMethylo_43020 [Methylobacterium sp.]GJE06803.1 hypothetical protein AOPFMNJM_2125 [Methylobacterium jeotgali]